MTQPPPKALDERPVQLYAVLDEGPVRVPGEGQHAGFEGLYEGLEPGVYTALRTFKHNCFLELGQHLRRLRTSMLRFGMTEELHTERVCRALHELCSAYPGDDMRVRIDVLAASAIARGVNSSVLIALAPFTAPDEAKYRDGVSLVSTRALERPDPLTKTARFADQRRALMKGLRDAEDGLLVSPQGRVLEGASSNFYALVGGVLRSAGEGVLQGITRSIVLDLAHRNGIEVCLDAVDTGELASAEEAAISSSSRGLMPVVRIDGEAVSNAKVGPVMSMLRLAYEDYVARAARPAIDRRQRPGGNR